jgi:hypothetical protein
MQMMLEKETKYFETKLAELVKTDMGKFVLIKDEQIYGIYAAPTDALKVGYEKFREQPFFVRQILLTQQPLNFSNNYFLA